MVRFARWTTTHRKYVLLGWLGALAVAIAVAGSAGTEYSNNFTLPNSDAQRAADLLQNSFPQQAGDRDQIVFRVRSGTVMGAHVRARMEKVFREVEHLPHVTSVVSPYAAGGARAISADEKIAFATVVFDKKANLLPQSAPERVVHVARAAALAGPHGVQVELGGQAIEATEQQGFGLSTAVGLLAAIVVLLLTFGSLLAMGLPIVTALFGLGTGLSAIALFTHVVETPNFSSELAAMIGLGVGIDYALFILTRFREAYATPGPTYQDLRESVVQALDTAGRAVVFAGCTVVIALLGMCLLGVSFLYGVAISASIGVLLMMFASLTLLPAMLATGPIGRRVAGRSRRLRRRAAAHAPNGSPAASTPAPNGSPAASAPAPNGAGGASAAAAQAFGAGGPGGGARGTGNGAGGAGNGAGSAGRGAGDAGKGATGAGTTRPLTGAGPAWLRWSAFVERRPRTIAACATLLMLAIASPAIALRLGSSDAANDPSGQTTHRAYELLARGFGQGFNGPLQIVAKLPAGAGAKPAAGGPLGLGTAGTAASGPVAQLRRAVAGAGDVAQVAPAKVNAAGNVAVITAYPYSSPQAYATSQLVQRLRGKVVPPLSARTGMKVYVGGVTAGAVDFATTLSHKLPLFIGVVVVLSALLLLIVFRSLVIPVQAAVMNLLSIGASLGVIVAIFQWGWLRAIFGMQQGPIESFIPVMLFAIVFGLSMDYEVFLVSRIRERWMHTHDASRAVAEGLALTGRVVTAAAAIMVCVFLSFLVGGERVIGEFGLSLSSAVFLDAFIVRCLLLPATLHLIGPAAWRMPTALARRLPHLNIEGTAAGAAAANGLADLAPPAREVAAEGVDG